MFRRQRYPTLSLLTDAASFKVWYISLFATLTLHKCILPPGLGPRDPLASEFCALRAFDIIAESLAPHVGAVAIHDGDRDDPTRLVRRLRKMYGYLSSDWRC